MTRIMDSDMNAAGLIRGVSHLEHRGKRGALMVYLDKLQILQIAKEICAKHRCEIVEIDFHTHVINIEGPPDEPELREACMKEIEEMLALYLS